MTGQRDPGRERWPDFYIVGAPRSGTTWMYLALGRHPRVFAGEPKEPNHFCADLDSGSYLDSLHFTRNAADYVDPYRPAAPGQLIGDGSTTYLFSRVAAGRIAAVRPDARIIIMLRDPVEMIHSFHARRVFSGSEDLHDLRDALSAEEDRRNGRRIPTGARNIPALQYRAMGRYSEQVERFMRSFPADQLQVIVFEDFAMDPAAAERSTLKFLGLNPVHESSPEPENRSPRVRMSEFHRLVHSATTVRIARAVLPVRLRKGAKHVAERLTTSGHERSLLDPTLRRRLRGELRGDVRRLGNMLGRDLESRWWG